MGITIFKIFIWGGISSDIRSEITFKTKFRAVYPTIYHLNENFEYSYTVIDYIQCIFVFKNSNRPKSSP